MDTNAGGKWLIAAGIVAAVVPMVAVSAWAFYAKGSVGTVGEMAPTVLFILGIIIAGGGAVLCRR